MRVSDCHKVETFAALSAEDAAKGYAGMTSCTFCLDPCITEDEEMDEREAKVNLTNLRYHAAKAKADKCWLEGADGTFASDYEAACLEVEARLAEYQEAVAAWA